MRIVAFALLVAIASACAKKERADLVILGGNIYTVNPAQPTAEAVAVRDSLIVFVGSRSGAESFITETTEVIDLKGETLTPGFIEGHAHVMDLGLSEMNLNLSDARSFDEVVERVRAAAEKAKPGEWILGGGWHQDKWAQKPAPLVKGFPVHDKLSAAAPDNPVFLDHASGHAALANARAMELAGVSLLSREGGPSEIAGGEVIRDANGNPTGVFNETAVSLIARHIPPTRDPGEVLGRALDAFARNGITSVHDAGATRDNIELFREFDREQRLRTRLYVMVSGRDPRLVHEWLRQGPLIRPFGFLTIRSIKLNCDGALGSRGAWLLEPYSDRPETSGMATLSMDTVLAISRLGLERGFQVCSHAIGDRANREILDRYATAFREKPEKSGHRFRIEHAQHLHPDDIGRFAALGVIPAMQAIHMSSDRPWAIERLGEKRIREGAYMWQSLLASGARIVNGTDAPVEPVNPIPSFYASVTRRTLQGFPPEGFEPAQRMSREQALRSYTLDAAYGAFEEGAKGSVEVGKLADFTVFSSDLMTVPDSLILKTEVSMTIVGGKIVYQR